MAVSTDDTRPKPESCGAWILSSARPAFCFELFVERFHFNRGLIMSMAKRILVTGFVYVALGAWGVANAGVIDLAGLVSVSIFERSFATAPTEFVFGFNSTQMTSRLSDPLSATNRDFIGTTFGADENYDVFYSDSDGTFNLNGDFVTVTADYAYALDSGLNLAGVRLNFVSVPAEFANSVASFVALGAFPFPGTVSNAVDGDINTHTFMGDTVGQSARLRVTVGFESTSVGDVPEPVSLAIFGFGALGLVAIRRRTRNTA